jgi:hypothetical protein
MKTKTKAQITPKIETALAAYVAAAMAFNTAHDASNAARDWPHGRAKDRTGTRKAYFVTWNATLEARERLDDALGIPECARANPPRWDISKL